MWLHKIFSDDSRQGIQGTGDGTENGTLGVEALRRVELFKKNYLKLPHVNPATSNPGIPENFPKIWITKSGTNWSEASTI